MPHKESNIGCGGMLLIAFLIFVSGFCLYAGFFVGSKVLGPIPIKVISADENDRK